jgi:hypothetical protein
MGIVTGLWAIDVHDVLMHLLLEIGHSNRQSIAESERQQADKQCQHKDKPFFQQMIHDAEQSPFSPGLSRRCGNHSD